MQRAVSQGEGLGIPWANDGHLIDLDFTDDIALLGQTQSLQDLMQCLDSEAG